MCTRQWYIIFTHCHRNNNIDTNITHKKKIKCNDSMVPNNLSVCHIHTVCAIFLFNFKDGKALHL